jgi:autotransporter-associated beta strand protein
MKIIKLSLCLLAGAFAPVFSPAAVTLTANDAAAAAITSFNGAGHWSDGLAPSSGKTYDTTSAFMMRGPNSATSYTFGGDSLQISGPGSTVAGGGRLDLQPNGAGQIITVGNLIVTNFGMIQNGGTGGILGTLAGAITVNSDATIVSNGLVFLPNNGQILVTASISGSGTINLGASAITGNNAVTLAGNLNSFTGAIISSSAANIPLVVSNAAAQTLSGPIGIVHAFSKLGGGALTLSGSNSFSAGFTLNGSIAGAQVNLNSTNALGAASSTFTISGGNNGAIDNTSGAAITNLNNNPMAWNSDFTFVGSNPLNLGDGNVTINATRTVTVSASTLTVGGVISGAFGITKNGAGTLLLNGANSYPGSTLIQTGTVALASGTMLASTNLSISAGATLDVGALGGPLAMNYGQYLTGNGKVNGSVDTAYGGLIYPGGNFAAGTLTVTTNLILSAGGTLSFDLAHNTAIGGGTNDLIVVGGNLNVAGYTPLALNFLNGSPATGTYTLIRYGTISGDTTLASITLPINPRYSLILSNDTVHKAVELVVAGVPGNLVWRGDGGFNGWDNFGSYQNWTNTVSTSLDFFYDGDNATFNDLGSASPAIYLTAVNSPGSLVVNATQTYDFTGYGGIAGVASLNKSGSGTLILETANSYAGPTIINKGTVQIGNANASGTLGAGAVTNNGTLAFDRTDGISVANDLHGTGSVIYNGTGSVTPTSVNNDYTGSTVVNNGTLYAATSAAFGQSSGTTVNSGGQVYITANVNIGAEPLILAGVGNDGNGALRKGGAGATTYGGALTLSGNTTLVVDGGATLTLTNAAGVAGASNALTVAGSGTLTLGGPVSLGTNALTVSGGTLNLNSTNYYSGGTTLASGVVNVNTNGALGSGPVTATTTGRLVIGTGLNITNAFTATTVNPGSATGFLMTADNTNGTVTTVSGPIIFNSIAISGGHFAGPTSSGYLNIPGTITLPAATPMIIRLGNLRFSGGGGSYYTEIQPRANITSIGANNGIATNAVMDLAGNGTAFFDLNGFHQTLAGLKNAITPANAGISFVTNSSAAAATLTLDLGVGNYFSFGGHIVGNQSLVMASGQQVLTGTSTYTGNTTVNGGTLELGQPTLFANSTVSVANGATLQLDFVETNQVAGLVTNGVSAGPGVYNSITASPYLTGSGSLLVLAATPLTGLQFTASPVISGTSLMISATNTGAGTVYLLTSTNVAAAIKTWTPIWTNVLTGNGSFTTNLSNAVNPALKQQFYILSNTNN